MKETHEYHLHILVCIDRLNAARATLNQIQLAPSHALAGPAFRYALVEYATAFTDSHSPSRKSRKLPTTFVPLAFKPLHERLIRARKSTHAHADINILEATLEVHAAGEEKQVGVVQNSIHGLEELPNLTEVISLIESVLLNLYTEREQSKERIAT